MEFFYDGVFGFPRPDRMSALFGQLRCKKCHGLFIVRFTGQPDYIVAKHNTCGQYTACTPEEALAGEQVLMPADLAVRILASLKKDIPGYGEYPNAFNSYCSGNPTSDVAKLYRLIFYQSPFKEGE